VTERPAETAAFAGAVATLVGYVAGIDEPGVLVALTVIVGAIPAVVTAIVNLKRRS
jgi:hypothetical protein